MNTKKILKHTIFIYIGIAIFCIIFNYIYTNYFGHGVISNSMEYAFLYPLILGGGAFFLFYLIDDYERIFFNLYNAGIATLTFGIVYQGVIDIAGADTTYSTYYYIIGIGLITIALIIKSWMFIKKKN